MRMKEENFASCWTIQTFTNTLNNSDCIFSSSKSLHLARVFHPVPASNPFLFKSIQNLKETMTNKLLLEQQASQSNQKPLKHSSRRRSGKQQWNLLGKKKATTAGIFSLSTKHQCQTFDKSHGFALKIDERECFRAWLVPQQINSCLKI